jgi:UDP-N-acetylmuramate: L-alanyl-gamma-D-glutamyl-meso-diaminopimelate ligase
VRTVPRIGRIVCNGVDPALARVLAQGCWTPVEKFSQKGGEGVQWSARVPADTDFSRFEVLSLGNALGELRWQLLGAHNVDNALAAIAAARHAGVPVERSIDTLTRFKGVARRMQLRGEADGVKIYDDFAHHPTAIATTIDGLRRRVGRERIVAVLEPRSNTMELGVHRDTLAASLAGADEIWLYAPANVGWDVRDCVAVLGARAHVSDDMDALLNSLTGSLKRGDHALIMSNGGFGGLHTRLLDSLKYRAEGGRVS